MVHRIEILSRNPAMSRIIPRTIIVSLSVAGDRIGRAVARRCFSRPPLRGVAIHP
jgi:hypothetical protein